MSCRVFWILYKLTVPESDKFKWSWSLISLVLSISLLCHSQPPSLFSPEVYWAGHVPPFCPRPDTKVSISDDQNWVFMYTLINDMLIWHPLLPTPKDFLLIGTAWFPPLYREKCFPFRCIKWVGASLIMKEKSYLFYWFNGSGPSQWSLNLLQYTHTHIHVIKQRPMFFKSIHFVDSRAAKRNFFICGQTSYHQRTFEQQLSATCLFFVGGNIYEMCKTILTVWDHFYVPHNTFVIKSLSEWKYVSLCFRPGLGSSYLPPGETAGQCEQLQPDSLYSSRGLYADELPSSARPRPVGGTTGTHADTYKHCPVFMPVNTLELRCCT